MFVSTWPIKVNIDLGSSDDVVFLIFLYQVSGIQRFADRYQALNSVIKRWIYRIDPKRINEYGQVMAGDIAAVEESKKDR